jgi:hypothetical protein
MPMKSSDAGRIMNSPNQERPTNLHLHEPNKNRADAYAQVHQIQARSQELREVDLQLMAEEQAKEQNTSVANALEAILK